MERSYIALDDLLLQDGPCPRPGGSTRPAQPSHVLPTNPKTPGPALDQRGETGAALLTCPGLSQLPVTSRSACVAGATCPGPAWEGLAGTGAVGPRLPGTPSPPWTTLWAQKQVGLRCGGGPGTTHTARGPRPTPLWANEPSRSGLPSPSAGSTPTRQPAWSPALSHFQATLFSLKPVCWAQGAGRLGCAASLCLPPSPPASDSGTTWVSRSTSVSAAGPPAPGWQEELGPGAALTCPDPRLQTRGS